jgi:Zn-dependent protease
MPSSPFAMFENAWYIGSFSRIPVKIHWTFLLIVLYVIGTGLSDGATLMEIAIEVAFILTIFVCVVLHEFGHALTAQRFGIKTEDIILLPIGGVARLRNMPEKPMQELIVAVMGPVVNVAIAILIGLLLYSLGRLDQLSPESLEQLSFENWQSFLPLLLMSNVMLVLFNMIPAFPMDGGRVLRALLSMGVGRLKATRIATLIGQAICLVLVGVGLYYGAYTLALIGVFIFFSATQEYRSVALESALKAKTVRDCFNKDVPALTEFLGLTDAFETIMHHRHSHFPVINLYGQYCGWVSVLQIREGLRRNQDLRIGDVCSRTLLTMHPDTALTTALNTLAGDAEMVLVGENEQVLGTLDRDTIRQFIERVSS